MNGRRRRQYRPYRRVALLSAAALSVIAAAGVFWGVNAASEVSPSDCVSDSVSVVEAADGGEKDEAKTITGEFKGGTIDFSVEPDAKVVGPKYANFIPGASFDGCYRNQLTDKEKIIHDAMVENYVTKKSNDTFTVSVEGLFTFDASRYDLETLFDVGWEAGNFQDDPALVELKETVLSAEAAFYPDHPEAYWISGFDYYVGYEITGTEGRLTYIRISSCSWYTNAYAEFDKVEQGIQTAVKSIEKSRASDSRYDTLVAIHNYICENVEYDYEALEVDHKSDRYRRTQSAAMLFNGTGKFVCAGYARAFKILCDKFDIPCVDVRGGNHAWNNVQMEDGKWYAVDVTWDDGEPYDFEYFLVGSNTEIWGSTFSESHVPDGQILTTDMAIPLVYPTLSQKAYVPFAQRPENISLTTLGASIRLSKPYGIRFGVKLKKDAAYKAADIVEYGTLVIGSGTLGTKELTVNTDKVRKIKATNLYSEDSSQLTYTGVLTNIPESFFDTDVTARGYLIYRDDDGDKHVLYSNTVEKSFYGVAQAAYDNYSAIANPNKTQQATKSLLEDILAKKKAS